MQTHAQRENALKDEVAKLKKFLETCMVSSCGLFSISTVPTLTGAHGALLHVSQANAEEKDKEKVALDAKNSQLENELETLKVRYALCLPCPSKYSTCPHNASLAVS